MAGAVGRPGPPENAADHPVGRRVAAVGAHLDLQIQVHEIANQPPHVGAIHTHELHKSSIEASQGWRALTLVGGGALAPAPAAQP